MRQAVNSVYAQGTAVRESALSKRLFASLFVAVCITLISLLAVMGRAPYDDEIVNFRWVQPNDVSTIIHIANSQDVHPPGSYVINKLLYGTLGSWDRVKAVSGCMNALGLALFLWLAYGKLRPQQRWLLTFMIATASTVVMWGASVRWYAYFNPLFSVTLAVILFADISRTARTFALGASAVLLLYLSYGAFCAVPVLAVAHGLRDYRDWKRRDIGILLAAGVVALLICLPQLESFIRVHMPNQASQTGSRLQALLQTGMTLILGNAVFPLATVPIAFAAVISLTVITVVVGRRLSKVEWLALGLLLLGVVLMTATGIGIKPRNSVYLLPLAYLLISAAVTSLPTGPRIGATIAVVIYQALGVWNVIAHENTIKGSYNTDYSAIVGRIESWSAGCSRTVVFNHDPVLAYLLEQKGIAQSSPYASGPQPAVVEISPGDCVAVVETYRGIIAADRLGKAYASIESAGLQHSQSQDFDPDRYQSIKARLGHEAFPSFYAHLDLLRAPRRISINGWAALGSRDVPF